MKQLYQRFFHISKSKKVSEHVFMTHLLASVFAFLACVVILCSGTFAYFTATVSTSGAVIQTATYSLTISAEGASRPTTIEEPYVYTSTSSEPTKFLVSAEGSEAGTGYCKIVVTSPDESNNPETYYTTQLFSDARDGTVSMELAMQLPMGYQVTFVPQWGTSANYAIDENSLLQDGGSITVIQEVTEEITAEGTAEETVEEIAEEAAETTPEIIPEEVIPEKIPDDSIE